MAFFTICKNREFPFATFGKPSLQFPVVLVYNKHELVDIFLWEEERRVPPLHSNSPKGRLFLLVISSASQPPLLSYLHPFTIGEGDSHSKKKALGP
jgi:hypothetical protein